MAHPRKPPYRRKNLSKISYAGRVIANFIPNFVAMATGVGRGFCFCFCPYPLQTPVKDITQIMRQGEMQLIHAIDSLPWQRGLVGENAIGSIRWPIPENPPIGAKISQKSPTQAEL